MQSLRLRRPRWVRPRSVHGAHAAASLTLSLALVAALASCDEKTRTTTEPAAPADLGAEASGGPLLAAKGKLDRLPVNEDVATTAPDPAFRINQTGTGPNGIFQISNATNDETALQGLTNGTGPGGVFHLTNTANNQAALLGLTNGSGWAVMGLVEGMGGAATFQVNTPGNNHPALFAVTQGTGSAGVFSASNAATTLYAEQAGTGKAAQIRISNPANANTALEVTHPGSDGVALAVTGKSIFEGNVIVNGTLTKSSGSFRIDHPLDPEHKFLSHSFVESPDMMNVYNGNVVLDANGRATVGLPEYFEALNREFRYQLTPIGSPGPNLYIAEGVEQNCFKIAGGRAYAHVSWQVTGVRQDTYANDHRIPVEETKPSAERGLVARR